MAAITRIPFRKNHIGIGSSNMAVSGYWLHFRKNKWKKIINAQSLRDRWIFATITQFGDIRNMV